MIKRKVGERKKDLSSETTDVVLKKTKPLIRTDWGGGDPLLVIEAKLIEMGAHCNPTSCLAAKMIAEEQVAGCRKRTYPRLDEAIKRLRE